MTETMYLGNRHTLTDAELETVLDTVADDGEVAGVVALWELILDVDWLYPTDLASVPYRPGSIDPTVYAIPARQWKVICQAMMNNPQHDGMPGGTMMNSGPSGYGDVSAA